MFTKVSVLVPTRHREARLRALLSSYERTVRCEESAEMVFRVDEDDRGTQEFLCHFGHLVLVAPRHRGYESMPLFFNELAAAASGDVLLCGNDDMVFHTPEWADAILEVANQYPDGLFDIGVSTHNETHYPFSVVSRRVVETLGFLWDPRIFWGDIFLRDVMAYFGRCVMAPHVQIDHDWAGNNPDGVFLETRRSKSAVEGDPSYWIRVHAPAVAEAVEKLKVLNRSVRTKDPELQHD